MSKAVWFTNPQTIVAGNNVHLNTPFGFRIMNLCGTARVTTTGQNSIPVRLRYESMNRADEAMIIPRDSFVVSCAWRIPDIEISPTELTRVRRTITGTTGDRILISTARTNSATPIVAPAFLRTDAGLAEAIGAPSAALASSTVVTTDYGRHFVKWTNPWNNPGAAVAGLGTYSATADADRTVHLYVYTPGANDTTAGTAGGNIRCSNDGRDYGYPDFIDIPVFVTVVLPPLCPLDYDSGVVVYDRTFS